MLHFYQEQVKFDKMVMSALYYTNKFSWIYLSDTTVRLTQTYYPDSETSNISLLNANNNLFLLEKHDIPILQSLIWSWGLNLQSFHTPNNHATTDLLLADSMNIFGHFHNRDLH